MMRKITTLIALVLMSLTSVSAQSKKENTKAEFIVVKTSAVCGMCKTTIEKALSKEAGVSKSKLDVSTKMATVFYDPTKTDPEKIRKAITLSGYDADNMTADVAAYDKLHECCKKDSGH